MLEKILNEKFKKKCKKCKKFEIKILENKCWKRGKDRE